MHEKVDLNLFRVFTQVFLQQSITLAAEQLNVTQVAVSGSIKRLTEHCGQDLFIRHGQGIVATHYAQQLMRQLTPALSVMDGLVQNMSEFDSQKSTQTFTVLALESLIQRLQPMAMKLQQQGYPLIIFDESHSTEEAVNDALRLQQADLAIDTNEHKETAFNSVFLYEDRLVLICRQDHPRIKESISLDQYINEQHIALKMRRANMTPVDFYSEQSVTGRKIVASCSSLLSLATLVAQGDCIGAISESLACKYQHALGLKIIEMPMSFRPVKYYLQWHVRQQDNPAHRWLRDVIKAMF